MDAISRMDQFRSHATINETHTHILYRGLVKDHFVFQLSCHCLNSTTTMLLSNSFCCMHSVIENWVAVACELCISTNLPVCVCMPRRQTVGVHRTNKTSSKQWMAAAAAAETEKNWNDPLEFYMLIKALLELEVHFGVAWDKRAKPVREKRMQYANTHSPVDCDDCDYSAWKSHLQPNQAIDQPHQ